MNPVKHKSALSITNVDKNWIGGGYHVKLTKNMHITQDYVMAEDRTRQQMSRRGNSLTV